MTISYKHPNNSVNILKLTSSERSLFKQICSDSKLKERDIFLYRQLDFFSRNKGVCFASNKALLTCLPQFTPKTLKIGLLHLEQQKLIARTIVTKRNGGSLRFVITKSSYPVFCSKQRSFGNKNIAEITEHYFEASDSPKKIDLHSRFRFSLLDSSYEITPQEHVSAAGPIHPSPQVPVSHISEENLTKNQYLGPPYILSYRESKNKRKTYSVKTPEVKDSQQESPIQSPVVLSSLEKNLRCSLPKEKIPQALAIWSTFSPSKRTGIKKPAAYLTRLIALGVCVTSLCAGSFSLDAMSSTKTPFSSEMDLRKIACEFVEKSQSAKLSCVTVDMNSKVLMVYTDGADTLECYREISFDLSPVHFWEQLGSVSHKYHLCQVYEKLKSVYLNI